MEFWGPGRGSPMLHVDFKKWQFTLSLFLQFHVDFKIAECPPSNLRKGHVGDIYSHVD